MISKKNQRRKCYLCDIKTLRTCEYCKDNLPYCYKHIVDHDICKYDKRWPRAMRRATCKMCSTKTWNRCPGKCEKSPFCHKHINNHNCTPFLKKCKECDIMTLYRCDKCNKMPLCERHLELHICSIYCERCQTKLGTCFMHVTSKNSDTTLCTTCNLKKKILEITDNIYDMRKKYVNTEFEEEYINNYQMSITILYTILLATQDDKLATIYMTRNEKDGQTFLERIRYLVLNKGIIGYIMPAKKLEKFNKKYGPEYYQYEIPSSDEEDWDDWSDGE